MHQIVYLQVLEGDKKDVMNTFNRIGKDYRHRGIITLLDRSVVERIFPDWTMGFKTITSVEFLQFTGYLEPHKVNGLAEGETFTSVEVITLLKSFASINVPGYATAESIINQHA